MENKPRKILRVITRLNIGGPTWNALLLTEGFSRNGYHTSLVSGSVSEGEGDLTSLAHEMDLSTVMIPELSRSLHGMRDVVAFWKLFQLMKREKPDIVHTHMAKAGALGRLSAVLAGVPVIVHTFHGHTFHSYFAPWKASLFLWVERFLAKRTHCLVAVSECVREELCTRYRIAPPQKVRVVPVGLDLEPFLEEVPKVSKERLGFPEEALLVGIVGRLVPIKDHEFLIRMASEICRKRKDVFFLIVGGGPQEVFLKQKVRDLNLTERVRFLGWWRDLPTLYRCLDIVVLTSKNEGTPISLIEAMACGRAVVATRVGGVPDVVQEGVTGYTVPGGVLQAFVDKVELLLDHRGLREQMGQEGKRWVRERFSKNQLLQNINTLYEELLSQKGR